MAHPQRPPLSESGPRGRKRARTRRAITEAAFALFAERGFEAVRITDIAARAEVAPATVFTHFRTKEEIFFERGLAANNGLAELVDAAASVGSLIEALKEFFHRTTLLYLGEDLVDISRTWAQILLESRALSDAYLVMDRERRRLLAAALTERARSDGHLPQPAGIEVLASMISAVASAAFRERHQQLAAGVRTCTELRRDRASLRTLPARLPRRALRPGVGLRGPTTPHGAGNRSGDGQGDTALRPARGRRHGDRPRRGHAGGAAQDRPRERHDGAGRVRGPTARAQLRPRLRGGRPALDRPGGSLAAGGGAAGT